MGVYWKRQKDRGLMKAQSKRASAIMRSRAAIRTELIETRGCFCEGCSMTPVGQQPPRFFTDMHEILTRARGGDPSDKENILCLCRECHIWITEHEEDARELGLVRARTAAEHQAKFRPWEL